MKISVYVDGQLAPVLAETGYLVVRNNFDSLVPDGTLLFRDSAENFTSNYPIVEGTVIDIYMEDDNDVRRHKFKVFNLEFKKEKGPDQFVYTVKVALISDHSYPLMTSGEFFSKRCKASEFVQYIAKKLGIHSEVEDTKETRDWIMPNWKYSQMLKYLAIHSRSIGGSSGFIYSIGLDNILQFKSIDKFFTDSRDTENITIDFSYANIQNMSLVNNLFSQVLYGANHLDLTSFNLTTGESSNQIYKFDEGIVARAKRAGVAKDTKDLSKKLSLGSFFTEEKTYLENPFLFRKVMLNSESNVIKITVGDNTFGRRVGDIVNINIVNNVDQSIELNFSGRYLIKSIVTFGSTDYFQTLTLVRRGINVTERTSII
jgi:hypothetical protein